MPDTVDVPRPFSRWLHVWAVLTVAVTFALLAVGQMVTSFRAGMADWVWPTEPWYVFRTATEPEKQRFREDFNFFIEHTHRILGWTVGILVSVLAIWVWSTQRKTTGWWVGLAGILVLLGGFAQFHDAMRKQVPLPAAEVKLPTTPAGVTIAGLVIAFSVAGGGLLVGKRGAGLRLVGILALVAVMIQGLLGGFRVKLNELAGTDLAAVHGIFAQVVFGLLISIAVLTRRPASAALPASKSRQWAVGLAVLLFVQVIWGALVRHDPTPLTQRLHYLTAFLATGVAVWVLMQLKADAAARARGRPGNILLMVLLTLQLVLGVEAWMEKFGAYTLPELVPITKTNAAIRTLHALIGSALLATAVGIAVRLRQVAGGVSEDATIQADTAATASTGEAAIVHFAATRGEAT